MLFSRECSTKCSPFASSSGLLESRDSECWRTIHSRKCGSKLRRYRKICRGSLVIGCTSFVYWRLAKRHIAPEYSMNILVETLVKYWISSFSSPKTWVCHFILSSFMYIIYIYIYTCVWYRFIYIYTCVWYRYIYTHVYDIDLYIYTCVWYRFIYIHTCVWYRFIYIHMCMI